MGDGAVVTIQEGALRGTTFTNLDGDDFFAFLGVPYGEAPVGELRFQPPQPKKPWQGVRDASEPGHPSISRDELALKVVGSEDCLNLNVYTRQLPKANSDLRPVMVYIHGGGLKVGSNKPGLHGPHYLLTQDIVLVIINYRLGALGFLSVDGSDVHGNMGLKDQNLSLKWVQRNIKSFNGDPDNVTIFGESAGSASVHAHIISEASEGLFHKAILQSGSVLNPWFWGTKNNARALVGHLGLEAGSELEALKVLKDVPALDVYNAQEKISDIISPSIRRPFSAVVEGSSSPGAFLCKDPRDIIKEGSYNKVPVIMGYNDTEGMLIDLIKKFGAEVPPFHIQSVIPWELRVPQGSEDAQEIARKLEGIYSGSESLDHYDENTDGLFLRGIIEALLGHLESGLSPIFFYRISISTQVNFYKRIMKRLDDPGVCHADDLGYLFRSDISPEVAPGSPEDTYIRLFVQLWTNFARSGDPSTESITWTPLRSGAELDLLDIGKTVTVKSIPERKRLETWQEIYRTWKPQKLF